MRRARDAVATAWTVADGWLAGLREQLTPGQRWTSALGLGVALVLVLFGSPPATTVDGRSAGAAAPVPARPSEAPRPAGADVGRTPGAAEPGAGPDAALDDTGAPGPGAGSGADTTAPTKVVVLVRQGEGTPPRDDAAMAAVYTSNLSLPATVVAFAPDDQDTCREVAVAGRIVLVASDMTAELLDCLSSSGVHVLAAGQSGDVAGADGAGSVTPLRRGVTDSLGDLAGWGRQSGVLRGKVGIVASAAARARVEAASARFRSEGVETVATAYLAPDPQGLTQMPGAILDFAAKGVEVVVFALPVAQQSRWLLQAALLLPSVRYVVSDAADAIVNEAYPSTFEGAMAHTSLRVPWWAREQGPSDEQRSCQARWEEKAATAGPLSAVELARAFAWCQLARVLDAAVEASASGGPPERHLRSITLPSPLTSDVGPLPGGRFGPRADAVLTWRSSCGCWRQTQPFRERPSS